jgi:protein-disulfide isomerase
VIHPPRGPTGGEPSEPDDHVIGSEGAPVQLVEYGDYECSVSAQAHFEVTEVLRHFGQTVRYTYRHFPRTTVHPGALLAAQAAEAAGAQGRFWQMHSMLFLNQRTLTPPLFTTYAGALGLDTQRFMRDLRSGTHLWKVEVDLRRGARSGVDHAPTFFLDGIRVERSWGSMPLEHVIAQRVVRYRH